MVTSRLKRLGHRNVTIHVREVATSKEAMPTIDRRMGVRVAQSQQSPPGDHFHIVQEQLHRGIPTKIFRVFVLLFPALLETRDERHRKRPSPQRAAQGNSMTSSTCRTFRWAPSCTKLCCLGDTPLYFERCPGETDKEFPQQQTVAYSVSGDSDQL